MFESEIMVIVAVVMTRGDGLRSGRGQNNWRERKNKEDSVGINSMEWNH